jgi:hypothetical protein
MAKHRRRGANCKPSNQHLAMRWVDAHPDSDKLDAVDVPDHVAGARKSARDRLKDDKHKFALQLERLDKDHRQRQDAMAKAKWEAAAKQPEEALSTGGQEPMEPVEELIQNLLKEMEPFAEKP